MGKVISKYRPEDEAFLRKFIASEETKRLYPMKVPPWGGGFRWFESSNIVDLQDYRSAIEKARIRRVLLGHGARFIELAAIAKPLKP
jgi:hypothetical protein